MSGLTLSLPIAGRNRNDLLSLYILFDVAIIAERALPMATLPRAKMMSGAAPGAAGGCEG